MNVMERIKKCGIVPVVVLDDAKDAVPTAQAMMAGGIDEVVERYEAQHGTES